MSADWLDLDEAQEATSEEVSVIISSLASSAFSIFQTTGTPKLTTNYLIERWNDSSQAEWLIWCHHCGYWNIPSIDQDLLRILEGKDGPACAKCGKPVNPDNEKCHWCHGRPERRFYHSGYHAPQIIYPIHFAYPFKWHALKSYQKNWRKAKFLNEVCGEPCDEGISRLTEAAVRKCCTLPPLDTTDTQLPGAEALKQRKKYHRVILGVDWGGKGEAQELSRTAVVALGKTFNQPYECFWMHNFAATEDMGTELRVINYAFKALGCEYLVYDFLAGPDYEFSIRQNARDIPQDRIFGIRLDVNPRREILYYEHGVRGHYVLDKTRSLILLIEGIKNQKILFPKWESCDGILLDLLALQDEYSKRRASGDMLLITRKSGRSDDFAQALNFSLHIHALCIDRNRSAGSEYRFLLGDRDISMSDLI